MNESNNNKVVKKHTPLGVFAFVLSITALLFFIIYCLIIVLNVNETGGIAIPAYFILGFISTVSAIVDLVTGTGKKSLSIWALILVWGVFVILIIFGIIFLMYYQQFGK